MRYKIETRATVRRVYVVDVPNEAAARRAIGQMLPDVSEDEDEEIVDLRLDPDPKRGRR